MNRVGWRRASRCVSEDNCVEVMDAGDLIGIRNSQLPAIAIAFPVTDWNSFIRGVKDERFDSSAT